MPAQPKIASAAKRFSLSKLLLGVVLSIGLSSAASAAPITVTSYASFSVLLGGGVGLIGGSGATGPLDRFNPGAGTLIDVDVVFDYVWGAVSGRADTSGSGGTYWVSLEYILNTSFGSGWEYQSTGNFTLGEDENEYPTDFNGPDSAPFSLPSASGSYVPSGLPALAWFEGVDDFIVDLEPRVFQKLVNSYSVQHSNVYSSGTSVSGTVSVTYTYEASGSGANPLPEPTLALLLGLGLLRIVAERRLH